MRARARDARTRAAVRSWHYRQRNLAAGVWYRLRTALAAAKAAYAISDDEARQLIAEGYRPEACGAAIAPQKTIVFVDEPRLSSIDGRRSMPVGLGPDFFGAQAIALVAFDDRSTPGVDRSTR
jgi:hypothetical protein